VIAARKAHLRTTRVGIGEQGWLLQRRIAPRPVVVIWRRAGAIGVIVLASKLAAATSAAVDYARSADARLSALQKSAWERTLDEIGPSGTVSLETALKLFALAYRPLPGTRRPPGEAGATDAGLAGRILLAHWSELTDAQRRVALRVLGLTGVDGKRKTSARGHVLANPTYGDPTFRRDTRIEATVRKFIDIYRQRMRFSPVFGFQIVAGTSRHIPPAADGRPSSADAFPITPDGRYSNAATICRIRVQPDLSPGSPFGTLVLAHEAFHCWQNQIMTPMRALENAVRKNWFLEGSADWAALSVFPVPFETGGGNLITYIQSPDVPLFSRTYDAVGFFGHVEESTGDLFPRMPAIMEELGDVATYRTAGGDLQQFLDSWGSSAANAPFGLDWTMTKPLRLPKWLAPTSKVVELGWSRSVAVEAPPYTLAYYTIRTRDYPEDKPLLHFSVAPYARLGNEALDTSRLADAWFCLKSACDCPSDTAGNPPPAPPIGSERSVLTLTGGRTGTRGSVTAVGLETFCTKTANPPGRAVAPPLAGGCNGGCGSSDGDPHLITFDGRFYDFHGAGEYVLARSTADNFEVQVRQGSPLSPPGGWISADSALAANYAVAMRVGSDRVAFYRGGTLITRLNGLGFIVRRREQTLPGGGRIKLVGDQAEVTWPDGTVARLWTWSSSIGLLVKPSAARRGRLVGLLGDFDGKQANDFRTRGGRQLNARKIATAHALLYRTFGDSWRVAQDSSLFDYAPGESTATFTDRKFPPAISTVSRLAPRARRLAEQTCRSLKIRDRRILASCVLDLGTSGDNAFATDALTLERIAGTFPPPQGARGNPGGPKGGPTGGSKQGPQCTPGGQGWVTIYCGPATARMSIFAGFTFRGGSCTHTVEAGMSVLRVLIGQVDGSNERTNGGKPFFRLYVNLNGPRSSPSSAFLDVFKDSKRYHAENILGTRVRVDENGGTFFFKVLVVHDIPSMKEFTGSFTC
jgi:hypothetical protein